MGPLDLILIAALACVVGLAVRSLWKGRRRSGCGGGCAGCPNSDLCHPEQKR